MIFQQVFRIFEFLDRYVDDFTLFQKHVFVLLQINYMVSTTFLVDLTSREKRRKIVSCENVLGLHGVNDRQHLQTYTLCSVLNYALHTNTIRYIKP